MLEGGSALKELLENITILYSEHVNQNMLRDKADLELFSINLGKTIIHGCQPTL